MMMENINHVGTSHSGEVFLTGDSMSEQVASSAASMALRLLRFYPISRMGIL